MLRATFFSLATLVLVSALAVQVPLQPEPSRGRNDYPAVHGHNHAGWRLDELPNPNSTDHLIFDTVYSLLQHFPNARMRKGHNIVPGIVPKGTLLYHGTSRKQLPPGPEWVAIDPELAYAFCWDSYSALPLPSPLEDQCWYLTLMTSRPLKVIYFDGSGAAKFGDGSLDAQDLIIWGESRAENAFNELERIQDLCKWVQRFGVDGIVRMAVNFEVMLCDFTVGVNVVSFVNLETPKVHLPDFSGPSTFESMNAHSRHDRLPGETRFELDLARLFSFYDTQLVPSLVPIRAGQERWDHRLRNISAEDLATAKSRVEAAMSGPWGSSGGINWKTLTQVIVELFAQRLELIHHFLNSPVTSAEEMIDLASKTQTQLRIILTPYILLSATPSDLSNSADLDWTIPIYKHCSTTHTHSMESQINSLTYSERLILQATRGTSREICRVVTKMWATGVYAGLDSSLNAKEVLEVNEITQVREGWADELNRLMGWLDWSVWVKCNPVCGPEEMCYMPTWPIGFPGLPPRKKLGRRGRMNAPEPQGNNMEEMSNIVKSKADEWKRPQPKCIRRVAPYEY